MTWLNNGSILQIENEDEDNSNSISIVMKECDEEFSRLVTSYGQIFNLLLDDPTFENANEACDKYSDLLKDLHTEEADFCYLCFILAKLCFFTSVHKNIRSQLTDLIKYIKFQDSNAPLELLCIFFDDRSQFHDKYISKGGSELIYSQIIRYDEMDTTEKWISQIDKVFQDTSSKFDMEFCQFIDQRVIRCDNYLLSVILTNFLSCKKTTPHNFIETGSKIKLHHFEDASLENKIFWGFFHENFSESAKYIFPQTNDMLFSVHFLHLLTLRETDKENIKLKKELDSAILRFTEIILSDYNQEQGTGLRGWAPSYLKIVNKDIRSAVLRILPAIKEGLQSVYIDNIQKLPNFVFTDNSKDLLFLYNINESIKKLNNLVSEGDESSYSDEELSILEEIVKDLNDNYIKCNDKMKSDILVQITPYLEKLDGLSGSVISCMLDIANGYSIFKENDPCPSLQKMLYDIILETGEIPEYTNK